MWLVLIVVAVVAFVLILRTLAKKSTGGSAGRSGMDGFVLLLNSLTPGEEGGRKLAEIFNNMEDGGAENLGGYLSGMPEVKIRQLASRAYASQWRIRASWETLPFGQIQAFRSHIRNFSIVYWRIQCITILRLLM